MPRDQTRYFVSYRRVTDGPVAALFAEHLIHCVGKENVFFDLDPKSLPAGISWPHQIVERVCSCDVLLPIIGPDWVQELESRNRTGAVWNRSISSDDWVRREIAFALHFGKCVVPVLVSGAALPGLEQLPSDLIALTSRQTFPFNESLDVDAQIRTLLEMLASDQGEAVSTPLSEEDQPGVDSSDLSDDLQSPSGLKWSPETESSSPHELDYKFSVTNQRERHRLRVGLLAALTQGRYDRTLSLLDLKRSGEPRKYGRSSEKDGLFLQASCLITDGMTDGNVTRVLMCMRESYQFHDKLDPRNVRGESCLIATCMTDFELHRGTLHLPKAVLNDLANLNLWAVFSRKLLMPDSVIDSRFLGFGFNLSNPNKEYLHLVWHIRTRSCPQMMLVPARTDKEHDAPIWQTLDQVAEYDFEKAPIDRAVLEAVLRITPRRAEGTQPKPLCGFVTVPSLDGGRTTGQRPERWERDTVPLDLSLMFQLAIHKSRFHLASAHSHDILRAFVEFVQQAIARDRIPVQIASIEFPEASLPFNLGVRLTVTDESGHPIGRYLFLAMEWTKDQLTNALIRQVRERAQSGFGDEVDPTAVVVLNGVHTDEMFALHQPISLHTPGQTPIHIVQFSLGIGGIKVKRISHAIIPVSSSVDCPPESLIVTLSPGDERPRLPGGKIEGTETPAQALARELKEEMDLETHEFDLLACVIPKGHSVFEHSPCTGRLTHYVLYPFVVKLHESGVAKAHRQLTGQISEVPCQLWCETFETWRSTGLGFDSSYPEAVLDQTTPELLADGKNTWPAE